LTTDDQRSIIVAMVDYSSRQLRAFILVAQYRSFARAAGRMFITPSGLSVMIRELESQVGVRLFDRTTRHVALTSAGSEFLRVVEPTVRDLDGAVSRIGGASGAVAPSITVGAVPLVAASVLARAIQAFRARRPAFEIHVLDRDGATIVQQIEAGRLDVGLGVFFAHLRGIRRTALFPFSFSVIRPADGRAQRHPATWASLKRERLISLDPAYPLQQVIDKHLTRAGVVQHPALVLSTLTTILGMVEAGQGVGIFPSYWLGACEGRAVVASRLTNPVVRLEFQQIQQSGRKLPAVAEEFISFLHGHMVDWAERIGAVQ
jgi:LysR family transcriptional regulator, carnitine catabolism transcriptional activator